jgi:AmmeMemoRadiSam system protein B
MTWTKPASHTGRFYPASADELSRMIEDFEKTGPPEGTLSPTQSSQIIGIVAPHAGYVFSGKTACVAYQATATLQPETIILLGLSHRTPLRGISILEATGCQTPLGVVGCDQEFSQTLAARIPANRFYRQAHLLEHSIETQLPFVQKYHPQAQIVEILTQQSNAALIEQVGNAIAQTATELSRSILIVSSTDLAHYPTFDSALKADHSSLEVLCALEPDTAPVQLEKVEQSGYPGLRCAICSQAAVLIGMTTSRALGARCGTILDYTNSGQSPYGNRQEVVGYGAVAWCTL